MEGGRKEVRSKNSAPSTKKANLKKKICLKPIFNNVKVTTRAWEYMPPFAPL